MKTSRNFSVAIVFATASIFTTTVSADHRNYHVRFDPVVQHALDLEYVATDLRECLRDSFRRSRLYGKLISRTNRVRNLARRLHRHGIARGGCNWHDEIYRMDALVCELTDLFQTAVERSQFGHDPPICGNAARRASRLIRQAEFHTRGLKQSLYLAGPVVQPLLQGPVFQQPAPGHVAHRGFSGIGSGVYRNSVGYKPHWTRTNLNQNAAPRFQPGISRGLNSVNFDRGGVGFNVGGLRFHVNR